MTEESKRFTLVKCDKCRITVENGIIKWSCDSVHDEFFIAMYGESYTERKRKLEERKKAQEEQE